MTRPDSRWMPLDWGDYWRDTGHLRGAGHGAYLNLIGAYWNRGAPLPTNDAALEAMSKCTTKEWRTVRGDVLAFFTERDGLLHHGRVDRELERAKTVYEKRREAARNTNAKRSGNRDGEREPEQPKTVTGTVPKTEPKPTPPLPQHSSIEEIQPSAGADTPLKTRIFGEALAWLTKTTRKAESELRPLLGKWCSVHGDGPTLEAISSAQVNASIDPIPYITKVLENSRRQRSAKPDEKPAVTETPRLQWVLRYQAFKRNGTWLPSAGPKPGEPGCQCPRDVIDEVELDDIPAGCDRRKPGEAA